MSPARAARKRHNRLTLIGIVIEISYVLGLSALGCFICALAYVTARWAA